MYAIASFDRVQLPPVCLSLRGCSRSASLSGLVEGGKGGSAALSPTSQAVQVLLVPLKEMLESMTLQQEVMREMVSLGEGGLPVDCDQPGGEPPVSSNSGLVWWNDTSLIYTAWFGLF